MSILEPKHSPLWGCTCHPEDHFELNIWYCPMHGMMNDHILNNPPKENYITLFEKNFTRPHVKM